MHTKAQTKAAQWGVHLILEKQKFLIQGMTSIPHFLATRKLTALWVLRKEGAHTQIVLCSVMRWSVKRRVIWPQEETEEGLRKTKFILLTAPRDGSRACQAGPRGGDTRVVRRQE